MGSPPYAPGRVPASDSPAEPLHDVRIPRSVAIASKEVSVAQVRRFLDGNPEARARHACDGNPGADGAGDERLQLRQRRPQIAVTWYEAAMYYNWLSRQECRATAVERSAPASECEVAPHRDPSMRCH